MERMAAAYASCAHPTPSHGTMYLDRLVGVVRTGGVISTVATEHGRENSLIRTDGPEKHLCPESRLVTRSHMVVG